MSDFHPRRSAHPVLDVIVSELRIKFAFGKRGAPRANEGDFHENGKVPSQRFR
jgi:hypothetical protein